MGYYQEHPKFYISTDCIIFGYFDGKLQVLIRPRDMQPGKGELSLMGGFVDDDESVDNAAKRTVRELTGLEDFYIEQVGAFGNVDRDPGERVVSICYFALIKAGNYKDELKSRFNAQWVDAKKVPALYGDHNLMVEKAEKILQEKLAWSPLAFYLIPEKFTLTQLQMLFETIYGETLDKRNFRKKLTEENHIVTTGEIDKTTSKRGANLFRFDFDGYLNDGIFKL
ncbi:MAG: NUDIX hydrolase [Bacteroidales bacterium]|jgi:ADP-ribose pyrophosphatase YjhB (NUDIX family)|nr:NUDIX hydrolase [Bacteroidales bacterium]